MHDEAAVEHVARCNQLNAINGVVVLRVGVAREEVLDDLEQEEDLGVLQDKVDCVTLFCTESDDIKVEQHIRDDDDGNNYVENRHSRAVCVQNVPELQKEQIE